MPTFVADEIVTAAKLNNGTLRDWTDWTPTLGGITVGSGVLEARYQMAGIKTVRVEFKFTLGAGSAVTGNITVTPPVTAARISAGTFGARLEDTGTAGYAAMVTMQTTTLFNIRVIGTNGIAVAINSTTPFTWTTGDIIGFNAQYEAA